MTRCGADDGFIVTSSPIGKAMVLWCARFAVIILAPTLPFVHCRGRCPVVVRWRKSEIGSLNAEESLAHAQLCKGASVRERLAPLQLRFMVPTMRRPFFTGDANGCLRVTCSSHLDAHAKPFECLVLADADHQLFSPSRIQTLARLTGQRMSEAQIKTSMF